MTDSAQRQPRYRFGLFEVFPDSGELWKHGHRIRIQEQPFRLLLALLEKPGELVSRETIRDRLWPENTFVEFDQSLGTAVTKLRQALGDEADNPRFIETVPKRGFRFLAPVSVVAPAASPEPVVTARAASDKSAGTDAVPSLATDVPAASESARSTNRRWLYAAVAAVVVLAIASPLVFRRLHPKPGLHPNDSVILAAIQNGTGDSIFDDTLYQAMRVKLNESPYFNVVPERSVRAALTKLNRNTGEQISMEDARLACAELKAQAVISGSIATRPGGLSITLTAAPCGPGGALATERANASTREEVLSQLGSATDALRRSLGEPDDSVQRFGTPLAQATTSSLAALQAFSAAEAKHNRGIDDDTIPQYKLATDLDPNFALAYARMGVLFTNENELSKGIEAHQKAFDLREHTTERERLVITAHYYSTVHGDLEKSADVYMLWRQLYPNDVVPPNNLADDYEQLGQPEKSLEFARDAVRLGPNNAFPRVNLCMALQRLGKFEEAKQSYADAKSRNLDYIAFHMALFEVAFAQKDEAAMRSHVEWARDNPRYGEMLNLMAWSKAAQGQMRAARAYFRQAEEISIKNGLNEFAADVAEDNAQMEADYGFLSQARAETARALELAPNDINVNAFASLIYARTGDLDRAEQHISKTDKMGPRFTIYQKMVLPTARAAVDLHRNDPEGAIQEMRIVAPYDLNRPLEMSCIYYRAEAFQAAHKYREAAAEYQRVIDHWFLRPVSLYIALSHLGVARARRADGDREGARAEYKTFFELWKDADPDIPILHQARAEAAHL
jgi:DNA-binding winged helix-turn-helix (wHTH) protein/tetratricopeptide (TPR) repeat protein